MAGSGWEHSERDLPFLDVCYQGRENGSRKRPVVRGLTEGETWFHFVEDPGMRKTNREQEPRKGLVLSRCMGKTSPPVTGRKAGGMGQVLAHS